MSEALYSYSVPTKLLSFTFTTKEEPKDTDDFITMQVKVSAFIKAKEKCLSNLKSFQQLVGKKATLPLFRMLVDPLQTFSNATKQLDERVIQIEVLKSTILLSPTIAITEAITIAEDNESMKVLATIATGIFKTLQLSFYHTSFAKDLDQHLVSYKGELNKNQSTRSLSVPPRQREPKPLKP